MVQGSMSDLKATLDLLKMYVKPESYKTAYLHISDSHYFMPLIHIFSTTLQFHNSSVTPCILYISIIIIIMIVIIIMMMIVMSGQ